MNILPCYLVYPRDGIRLIGWLCLVNRPSVEAKWLIAACDRTSSHDGGCICFMLVIGFVVLHETRQGN
jgi:hypothetical protein